MLQRIPKDSVEEVRRRVKAGREFQDAVREVFHGRTARLARAGAQEPREREDEPFDATSSAPLCSTASSPPTVSQGSSRRSATTADSGASSALGPADGQILRQSSFHAVEALVRSSARRTLSIATPLCERLPGLFHQRLDPGPTRRALLSLIRGAKRNKAFDDCRWIGLALDGTGAGWRTPAVSPSVGRSRTLRTDLGCRRSFVMISVVGTGLSLPCDRGTLRTRR